MAFADWNRDIKLTDRITAAIKSDKLSHAYIIEGDKQTDKMKFAKAFLKALNCTNAPGVGCSECVSCRKIDHDNCEDLYVVCAEGLSVKDKAISLLQNEIKAKPVGQRSMVIIADADTMTVRAQNHLLKTLEEPVGNSILLLLSENCENLLQTIRSRCIIYRLNDSDTREQDGKRREDCKAAEAANALIDALIAGEKFFYIKQILARSIKNRDNACSLLDEMEKLYLKIVLGDDLRSRMLKSEKIFSYVGYIEEARRDLAANVNYNYALKDMILKIGGIYG